MIIPIKPILPGKPYPLYDERINELRQTFIQCFSPPSDTDLLLTEKLYEAICNYHNLQSNGNSEEQNMTLVENLMEFFNTQGELPPYKFKEFLQNNVESY